MSLLADYAGFLGKNHSAAMITRAPDGTPKAVRVSTALVDGKLWSSGTSGRVRTRRLRRDPRCTLFMFETRGLGWMAFETTVSILDGPDAAELNLRLFRILQSKPSGPLRWFGGELEEDEFLAAMVHEARLIYEFDVNHAYGLQ